MSDQAAVISAQRVTVILNGPNDWEEWLEIVKSKAREHDIWGFVNPATAKADIPNLEVPEISKATDVNPAATSIVKLEDIEKDIYRVLLSQFNRRISAYDQKILALRNLCTFIQGTVSRTYLCYTFNTENTYKMLAALKNRVTPTDLTRKTELSNCYQRMKKALKTQHIET